MQIYYHGDPIHVTVNINNTTNKVVKKIKITGERGVEGTCPSTVSPCHVTNTAPPCLSPVDQITDVVLYSLDKYTKTVCTEEIK